MTKPSNKEFYVYYLKDSDGKVFYIGKGSGDRIYRHEKKVLNGKKTHNNHLTNKISKILKSGNKMLYEKVLITWNEQDALKKEAELIETIGIANLCNLTSGGDGRTPTKEVREKISKNRRGIPCKEHVKESNRVRRLGTKMSDEFKKHQSELKKGKPQSEKQKAANTKRSEAMKGRKFSEEHKKSLSDAKLKNPTNYWLNKTLPEEMKNKISNTLKSKN